MARHPHRLQRDRYVGRFTHFLTASTYQRRDTFANAELALAATDQLMRACRKHGFADIAHTLMPDHVHILVEGVRPDADFLKWLDLWRQLAGFCIRSRTGEYLWQEGYWDYTLRDGESVPAIASYIVWNPVVAGLVARPEDYPFTGSERFPIDVIAATWPSKPRIGDI